jgi:hypothetical protein
VWGFSSIWAVDFEFIARAGDRPIPVCLVALDLVSGRLIRQWQHEFAAAPPYPVDQNALFVSYNASAEIGCHLALGWPVPARTLDLYVEFRNLMNGRCKSGRALLDAMAHFGLESIGATTKKEMIDLVLRGGPWSAQEQTDILDYCQSDVGALARLLPAMEKHIDLPRALLRGRYMAAVAHMEFAGVPIDVERWRLLTSRWKDIRGLLIVEVDRDYNVFEGEVFKQKKFEAYLARNGIPWPRTPTGRLATSDKDFERAARHVPALAPLRELRATLAQLKDNRLQVGSDGRNRASLWPFATITGRNAPSNTQYIFGLSSWLRSLIRPPVDHAIAYCDFSQQEFGIAAALSGDDVMQAAYAAGDPYLEFGKQCGLIPPDGTKESHQVERDLCKACVLAVQYGMGAESLAGRIGQPPAAARRLLELHRQTYRRFWQWNERVVHHCLFTGELHTVFNWRARRPGLKSVRTMQNFPMQANGAEMLRIAIILATEAGVKVCAPVHDAVLICAPVDRIDADVATMRKCMTEASRHVLNGFEIRTDVEIVRYPDRWPVTPMWGRVMGLLGAE